MSLKIPMPTEPKDGWIAAILAVVFLGFKKEIIDWIKHCYKSAVAWLRNWSERRNFVVRFTKKQIKEVRANGLVDLEASLYILLEEYLADRISVMEYEMGEDGGASATCLVEALRAEMPSVWESYQKKSIPEELVHEIRNIEQQPQRLRYVSDARVQDVAAMRAAMLKTGALSAYYQVISQPTQKPLRMLAFSWRRPHELTANQLNMLRFSGIMCSNVLSNLDRLNTTSTD